MASANVSYSTNWLQNYAINAANQNGIPPQYFLNFLNQESSWNPSAVGSAGELGIAQIIPGYHPAFTGDPLNPYASIDYAAATISTYARQFGSWSNGFAAWNAGPSAVAAGNIPNSTQAYVNSITGIPATSTQQIPSASLPQGSVTQGVTLPGATVQAGTVHSLAYLAGGALLMLAMLGLMKKRG